MSATLVIALVGALTGVGSLAWQAWSFSRSGPSVKVSVTGGVTSFRADNSADLVINVNAVNVGRSPCEVRGWGLQLPDGRSWVLMQPFPWNTPVPSTIAGGHRCTWMVPLALLAETPEILEGESLRVTGYVDLGSGKTVRSPKPYAIATSVIAKEARDRST